MNVLKQITIVATTQFIIYEIAYLCNLCNYVAIKSLQLMCHYIVIIMPLCYNYFVITKVIMC
jgi:hypothetical protein